MNSKQSTYESETNCIDAPSGYSLKKGKLKKWIYGNGKTQPFVARKLGITKEELQRKLNVREPFGQSQIHSLVYLVGAQAAIDIIYFPEIKQKHKVRRNVFGRKRKEENEQSERNEKIE